MERLDPEHLDVILYGTRGRRFHFILQNDYYGRRMNDVPFEGVINNLARRFRETSSEHQREEIEKYMSSRTCPACKGARLKPEALAVKVGVGPYPRLPIFQCLRRKTSSAVLS